MVYHGYREGWDGLPWFKRRIRWFTTVIEKDGMVYYGLREGYVGLPWFKRRLRWFTMV